MTERLNPRDFILVGIAVGLAGSAGGARAGSGRERPGERQASCQLFEATRRHRVEVPAPRSYPARVGVLPASPGRSAVKIVRLVQLRAGRPRAASPLPSP